MPPSSWTETTIRGCLADEFPGAWGSEPGRDGPNAHILRSTNLDDDGHINFATAAKRWIDEPHLTQRRLRDGDVLLESSGGGPGKPVGRVAHFQAPDSIAYLSSNFFRTLRPDETKVDSRFLAWRLLDLYRQPRIWNFQQQTTGIINLKTKDYLQQRFHLPEKPEQSRIALVLDTVDEAIAKTEAVIAKLRQMRAGLLHDILTRGLDKNGQLRDPIAHPEQFQDSPLGQIPKEWEVKALASCVSSEITYGIVQAGPHIEDGVPYIRTGDMNGDCLVADQMLRTSPDIAARFRRSRVQTGEVVCAIRATVGKVLPVPAELDGANLTQGTARIAPESDMHPTFLLWAIRGDRTQREIAREVKGTTFFEITLADLRRIRVAIPQDPDEQEHIAAAIQSMEAQLSTEAGGLAKLQSLKSGLMTDLLTGRVRVPAEAKAP